jgi:hypothetical protein
MKTDRGKAFIDQEPSLSDDEITHARETGKYAVSFKGMPVLISSEDIGFMAIKFALADGTFETVLLDQLAGEALWQLLESVKQIDWKTKALKPGPSRH